jgi:hypothetical protein
VLWVGGVGVHLRLGHFSCLPADSLDLVEAW